MFTIASLSPSNTLRKLIAENAHMGDEKAQRLDDALSSLVDILVPALPDEDEATADERHDDALELARSIIDKCVYRERLLQRQLTLLTFSL